MKRTIGLLLTLLLLAGMVPAGAFAAEPEHYDIWINGEEFTSDHMTIKCGSGTATLAKVHGKVRKIWLDNAEITKGYYNDAISILDKDLQVTIILTGSNKINLKDDLKANHGVHGIFCQSQLMLTGDGVTDSSLDVSLGYVKGNRTEGIYGKGTLSLQGLSLRYDGCGFSNCITFRCEALDIYRSFIHSQNSMFLDDAMAPVVLEPEESDYEVRMGNKSDGSDAALVEDSFLYRYDKNVYPMIDIAPKTMYIEDLSLSLVVPDHGQMYPAGETDVLRIEECPEGVAPQSVETLKDGIKTGGTASAGDEVTYDIYFRLLRGYELAPGFTATVNGKKAVVFLNGDEYLLRETEPETITYNEDIRFEEDLPKTTVYAEGGSIIAKVKTNIGSYSDAKFQWQIGVPDLRNKDRIRYSDISGATSAEYVVRNADSSYDGKYLRCYVSLWGGGKYSGETKLAVHKNGLISSLDFTFDLPNDGEELPNGADGIARVTNVPEGIKVTGTESVMFRKIIEGKAASGESYEFGIIYELLSGYDLASDFTVTINGEEATRILTPDGTRKAAIAAAITCDTDLKITKDLPQTIEFADGAGITAEIEVEKTGSSAAVNYEWQLGEESSSGGGKQKFASTFTAISGRNGAKLSLTGLDSSYDGKLLRCRIENGNGNAYSKTATLKLAAASGEQTGEEAGSQPPAGDSENPEKPHTHTFAPGYNEEQHWEKCSCGEVKLIEDHKLAVRSDAEGHWGDCECGYKTEKEEHEYGGWVIIKEATDKTAGRKERECELCGYKDVEAIPATALTTPFVDVPKDAYYYDATVWAYNAEPQITDGNGKDKFMPEQICTRGQVVTFLWRSAGQPAPAKSVNPFEDVKTDDYFYQPVLWAFFNNTQITDGTDTTHFSPNNPCKNSHILTFIWRALGEPGKTENAATWYTDAYNWAKYDANLLEGTFEGSYDINAQCPRKNVVQYLYRYYVMAEE